MKEKIKNIQVFGQSGELLYECKKGFSFLSRRVEGRRVSDVLMFKGGDVPVLNTGAVVDIVIVTRSEERLKYFCRVEYCGRNQLRVRINPEKAEQLTNHRRYYRIKTAINCRIVDVTRDGHVTQYNPNLYGKIYDINIGGVYMAVETADAYRQDDLISFTAVLGTYKLEASARVLRVQTSPEGEVIGYRCYFASLRPRDEDMISSYINHLQIEERRIELELEKIEKGGSVE